MNMLKTEPINPPKQVEKTVNKSSFTNQMSENEAKAQSLRQIQQQNLMNKDIRADNNIINSKGSINYFIEHQAQLQQMQGGYSSEDVIYQKEQSPNKNEVKKEFSKILEHEATSNQEI